MYSHPSAVQTQRSSPHSEYDISPPLSPSLSHNDGKLTCSSAANKRWKYFRRIFKYRQMDFQYALWQMLYLFISPQKVYRNFSYRKQSKNQWARDDPAFLVLLSLCLCLTSITYAVIFRMTFTGFLGFTLRSVFLDCIGVGVVIASIGWLLANHYFLVTPATQDKVEWGYCFDVHLNAFFPLLVILHGFGAIIYVVLGSEGVILTILGNTLLLISFSYYFYITFLGYDSLPILRKTKLLLFPFTVLAIFYIISLALRWNLVRIFHLYIQSTDNKLR
ncbi:protein unc-50 homolog isoform X2 [Watersipora subatra]|uniref:protein unc-50 homolog isoform X2 n=1 Tax=Watersipora subatra TaxID=2589382 RepID=UPI00355B2AC5